MNEEIERIIEDFHARQREARNRELGLRLEEGRTFEELLAELSRMRGLRTERAAANA